MGNTFYHNNTYDDEARMFESGSFDSLVDHLDRLQRDIGANISERDLMSGMVAVVCDVLNYAASIRTELEAVRAECRELRGTVSSGAAV